MMAAAQGGAAANSRAGLREEGALPGIAATGSQQFPERITLAEEWARKEGRPVC
jgi:hypothetical protein